MSRFWMVTSTDFCITTPTNNTRYLFSTGFCSYSAAIHSLNSVFWSNNEHFMNDLSSNSHFETHYATGIPEGYTRGGCARPYSKTELFQIAGIQFHCASTHSQGLVE